MEGWIKDYKDIQAMIYNRCKKKLIIHLYPFHTVVMKHCSIDDYNKIKNELENKEE